MFPDIPWNEPIRVSVIGGESNYGCRYCILLKGLRAGEVKDLWKEKAEAYAHINREHA